MDTSILWPAGRIAATVLVCGLLFSSLYQMADAMLAAREKDDEAETEDR